MLSKSLTKVDQVHLGIFLILVFRIPTSPIIYESSLTVQRVFDKQLDLRLAAIQRTRGCCYGWRGIHVPPS